MISLNEGIGGSVAILDAPHPTDIQYPKLEKFAIFHELGHLSVSKDFKHRSYLTSFGKTNDQKFRTYNGNIRDQNYSKVSTQIKPGMRMKVDLIGQMVYGGITSDDRMKFLCSKGAINIGAQGAAFIWEHLRYSIPRNFRCASLDYKCCLWETSDLMSWIPYIERTGSSEFDFCLTEYDTQWTTRDCFFCVTQI